MPWRSFINNQFETTQTTDMSTEKLESMLNAGWREADTLELKLARLLFHYGAVPVRTALNKLLTEAMSESRNTNAPPVCQRSEACVQFAR